MTDDRNAAAGATPLVLRRAPRREYRTFTYDSRRWAAYRPRADDVIISTYVKSGTTWMQRIVGMLLFQSAAPMILDEVSPWLDFRLVETADEVAATIERQSHRRFLKSHVPIDGLPFYDEVKYIHVARDGRDVVMSWFDHHNNSSDIHVARLTSAGINDDRINRRYPEKPPTPAACFHRWLTEALTDQDTDGFPHYSWFDAEKAWWELRDQPNVYCTHYRDLKSDLGGEVEALAAFLGTPLTETLKQAIVEAADLATMRRQRAALSRIVSDVLVDPSRFFNRGENERWRGAFDPDDLALFEAKMDAIGDPALASWLRWGKHDQGA